MDTSIATAQYAIAADRRDPLRRFRDRFVFGEEPMLYMDGNSLGRLPKVTIGLLHDAIEEQWGRRLIRGWNDGWYTLSRRLGAKVATIIGARPHEVVVCDSTSVNLFKLVEAAGRTVASLTTDFPSDLYVIRDRQNANGELRLVNAVDFRSGALADFDRGGFELWDVSHAVGVLPLDLTRRRVALAVGCTYKYLNGGPGAPAFLYVREDLQDQLANPIRGWFGHARPFDFAADYEPAPGIDRFLVGTPPVLSLIAMEPGLDLTIEAGIPALRAKSIHLTEYMIALHDELLAPFSTEIATPRDPALRGSHVSIRHPEAWRITRALIEQHQVIPDFRAPDLIRFGLAPIYTSFEEVRDAVVRLRAVLKSRSYLDFSVERQGVT